MRQFLQLAALLLFASPAWASWTLVQTASDVTKFTSTVSSTDAKAFTSSPASGDLLIAQGQTGATTGNLAVTPTCSDSIGNTWTAGPAIISTTDRQGGWMCWAVNKSTAADTITATGNSTSNFWTIAIHEFSGNAATSPADRQASQGPVAGTTGTVNVTSTATATLAVAGELAFGFVVDTSACPASIAHGTNYTNGAIAAASCFATEYESLSASTGIAATFTQGASITRYVAGVETFKPASSACPPMLSLLGVGRCG